MFYKERQDAIPDKNGIKLWRPTLVRTGKVVGTRELSKLMSAATTLTDVDIYAVILCLTRYMNVHLKEGHSVKLDGLGTFTLYGRSQGKGVIEKKDVRPSQFNNITCRFTPEYTISVDGSRTRSITEGIEFIHIDRIAGKANSNNEGGNNNNDDDDDPTA